MNFKYNLKNIKRALKKLYHTKRKTIRKEVTMCAYKTTYDTMKISWAATNQKHKASKFKLKKPNA